MAYRFTNTDKWTDAWFCNLKQLEMLLFIYLCDNCDIAGFIEVNYKRWATDLNSSPETIEGAIKGLSRGLLFSNENDCIFIRNFLKHQKNMPLTPEKNPAHKGIVNRFNEYMYKFDIKDINDFFKRGLVGATEGLQSPIGNGNGIGNDNGNGIGKKFQKPTISEIEQYCFERSNGIDPEKFFNYYESNGWMVGKNKMKNWKAAVHTWEKSNYQTNGSPKQPERKNPVMDAIRLNAEVHRMMDERDRLNREKNG